MKRHKRIALFALVFSIGLMAYSGEQWLSIDKVYQEANDVYDDYSNLYRKKPSHIAEGRPEGGWEAQITSEPAEGGSPTGGERPAGEPGGESDNGAANNEAAHGDQQAGGPTQGADHGQTQYANATPGDATADGPGPTVSPVPARTEPGPVPPTPAPAEYTPSPTPTASPEETAAASDESYIDFGALQAVNRNAVAWLYSPNTAIDYPVMRTGDYSYYLDRLPDGSKNANGSLFIDYNNASDFSSALTVIYGHNMKSGRMFGSLPGYKSQSYYNNHPYMYLYTERRSYRLDLIYGCTIGAGQWRERAFMYSENVGSLISYASHNTTFNSNVSYSPGDRVVVLSTCTFEFNDARYVVLGILRGI
jgi:SrtB family sortase